MNTIVRCFGIVLSIMFLLVSSGYGDVMYRPTGYLWNYGTDHYGGLFDQSYVSGVTDVDSYLATNPDSGPGYWTGPGGEVSWAFGIDLGQPVELTGMVIWQASNFYHIALSSVTVLAKLKDAETWTNLGSYGLSDVPSIQQVTFSSPTEAQYITWVPYWNFGNGRTTEIRGLAFTGVAAPEPISSILFVTGGTLLAGRRYLKRRQA